MKFDAMKEFLTRDTTPPQLAERLDKIMFDTIMLYGHSDGELVGNLEISEHCYFLRRLRDIFANM